MNAVTEFPHRRARLICALDALITGEGVAALVEGEQVAIFLLPDAAEPGIFAIGNEDPIGRAPVLSRGIVCDLDGEPAVASPLYKQHFSLVSGRCFEDGAVSVPVYRTLVSDGHLYLIA